MPVIESFRKGFTARAGMGLINAQWLILKSIKARLERKSFGVKEVFGLEKYCLFWQQIQERMKSDGKKDKWFDYDVKVQNLLLGKTNSLILRLKARSFPLDLSVFDDWNDYFDELEARYKSKNAEIDLQALQDFLKTEEGKEGLEKWRALSRK